MSHGYPVPPKAITHIIIKISYTFAKIHCVYKYRLGVLFLLFHMRCCALGSQNLHSIMDLPVLPALIPYWTWNFLSQLKCIIRGCTAVFSEEGSPVKYRREDAITWDAHPGYWWTCIFCGEFTNNPDGVIKYQDKSPGVSAFLGSDFCRDLGMLGFP